MSQTVTARIAEIQGEGYYSPLVGRTVRTKGVVIAHSRRGFFIQDPAGRPNHNTSCGLFVLSYRDKPPLGSFAQAEGKVLDYLASEYDRPVTEIKAKKVSVLDKHGPALEPHWLNGHDLPEDPAQLALYLNALEGMLCGIAAGAVLIAPSNPFADYVVAPADLNERFVRSEHGGVLLDPKVPDRWYPSFRIVDYAQSIPVNVGDRLEQSISGALNYRSAAWQLAVNQAVRIAPGPAIQPGLRSLNQVDDAFSVMTLNALNLDVKVESKELVNDPSRDIDDDVGEGRFLALAQAIVKQAGAPDIVAVQEIQDNDGAEITTVVDGESTYAHLAKDVRAIGGPSYAWVDIDPELGADGGQPGGNIRNGFLYRSDRVQIVPGSVHRLAAEHPAFEESRKPLCASFCLCHKPDTRLTVGNVHLASKRHQRGMFSPEKPGFDPKQAVRVQQARLLHEWLSELEALQRDYYLTGDFNDTEYSDTIATLLDGERVNLVNQLPHRERYDYNHRGKLQVLMHGIVSKSQHAQGRTAYEILHGNELIGVQPGDAGGKASDHAYTLALLSIKKNG